VVLPCLCLGLVELILRIAGVGYPTAFFLSEQIRGKPVFVENDRFGLQFFPPLLARSPSPLIMRAEKPNNGCRIFILGESAALGDPEPAFGFGRYLQVLLHDRFPQTDFEVICTAMTAINSHAIVPIARECAKYQGDIWVVYMGNNEFVGPFGPSTVFGSRVPPLSAIRLGLALKKTRLGQLLSQLGARQPNQKTWGGMKMFLDHQVAPNDSRKAKVYGYFRSNLETILGAARKAGAKVVLSTVAVNLEDCSPFASSHTNLLETQKKAWQGCYDSGVYAQAAGDFSAAISNYQEAARSDVSFAELQFRWGQCALALTNPLAAKLHFQLARDFDSLPFRTDDQLNQVIREVGKEHSMEGVLLMDAEAALFAGEAPGIPGKESFFEHVHLNFEGNYKIARVLAEQVTSLLPESLKKADIRNWPSFQQCVRGLALTDWIVAGFMKPSCAGWGNRLL